MQLLSSSDVEAFGDKLISELKKANKDYSVVWGHATVVHVDKWVAVYIYCPGRTYADVFSAIRRKARRITRELCPDAKLCEHDNSITHTITGERVFTFWLPVPGKCEPGEFRNFFPEKHKGKK